MPNLTKKKISYKTTKTIKQLKKKKISSISGQFQNLIIYLLFFLCVNPNSYRVYFKCIYMTSYIYICIKYKRVCV